MPNSVLEAMAAGLPVVAADTPAHREILSTGTGVLYQDRDGLRESVRRMVADPVEAARMGAAARQLVSDRFGFNAAVDSYLRLYAALLTSSSS
jgi:glycosyltransferase involved in cell wall biosynthesis